MSKIKTIHISNFKFFGESSPIILDGKNLLLYGENGSGKSSIYNALYTLFEAASKTPKGIRKYFVPLTEDTPESLVNIYAPRDAQGNIDSYIEVTDETNKIYRLSLTDVDLCGNDDFKESQRASDFISYKELFLFQLFRNSELSDLHDVFQRAVIPYLPCSTYTYRGQTLSSLSAMFESYCDIEAIKDKNPKGKRVIYKNKEKYKAYLKLEEQINQELQELVEYINEQLPSIIHSFGYNFNAFLRYENQSHKKYDMRLEPIPYRVFLEIDEYNGQPVSIKHPNVFLNEAKMSALAFAIRWAILTKRPDVLATPDALRVLVLDDLMISLDMGNREKILRFLLNDERARQYQILFMTHEKTLFECLKNKLVIKYRIGTDKVVEKLDACGWMLREMYDYTVKGKHLPMIEPYESNYSKALDFFNGHSGKIDYCACGNALRKAIEEEFVRIFESWHVEYNDTTITAQSKLMLNTLVLIGASEFPKHHISTEVIDAIEQLRSFVLNPSSHYNPESNFYKEDLEAAFEAYRVLQKIRTETIVPFDEVLQFEVRCVAGKVYAYEVKIFREIMANVSPMSADGEILDLRMHVEVNEVGGKVYPEDRKTLSEIYSETIKYLKEKMNEDPIDMSAAIYDVYTWNGKTINEVFVETIERLRETE